MDKYLDSLLHEWEFIRCCTKAFVTELSDQDIDRELPRRGLNTMRKHFKEMTEVQADYIAAIGTKSMQFNAVPDASIDGTLTKEQLLQGMAEADGNLKLALTGLSADSVVRWFGHERLLPFHLSALIAHEAQHIGQLIAFCYTLNIDIPEFVRKNWGLSGK